MAGITAIILAGGKGTRMQTETPKQYLPLLGKPVLFYSLRAFSESEADSIILVVGAQEIEYCRKEIVEKYGFYKVTAIVSGGVERYHSVYQGLLAAAGADYVLIHDGARPMIEPETIRQAICMVKRCGACAVGLPVQDTIQLTDEENRIIATPDRRRVWAAQTPQCFSYSLVREAYERAKKAQDASLTDDAMTVKRYTDHPVEMIPGSSRNIKLTTPENLQLVELWLGNTNCCSF